MNENMMLLLAHLDVKEKNRLLRMITAELQRERVIPPNQEVTLTELQLMKKHVAMRAAYIWTYKVFPLLESEIRVYNKLGGSEDDFAGGDFIEPV